MFFPHMSTFFIARRYFLDFNVGPIRSKHVVIDSFPQCKDTNVCCNFNFVLKMCAHAAYASWLSSCLTFGLPSLVPFLMEYMG